MCTLPKTNTLRYGRLRIIRGGFTSKDGDLHSYVTLPEGNGIKEYAEVSKCE